MHLCLTSSTTWSCLLESSLNPLDSFPFFQAGNTAVLHDQHHQNSLWEVIPNHMFMVPSPCFCGATEMSFPFSFLGPSAIGSYCLSQWYSKFLRCQVGFTNFSITNLIGPTKQTHFKNKQYVKLTFQTAKTHSIFPSGLL